MRIIRTISWLTLLVVLSIFISCGPVTGPLLGFDLYVNGGQDISKDIYKYPDDAVIGLTKVWIPTTSTMESLTTTHGYSLGENTPTQVKDTYPTNDAYYFKAIDTLREFDLSDTEPIAIESLPAYNTAYSSYLIEIAYLDLQVNDFWLRFYFQDVDTSHQKKDAMIRRASEDADAYRYAYWKETIDYSFSYDADGYEDWHSEVRKYTYTITNQTYEFVADTARPSETYTDQNWYDRDVMTEDEAVYNLLGEHPSGNGDPEGDDDYVEDGTIVIYHSIVGDDDWELGGSMWPRLTDSRTDNSSFSTAASEEENTVKSWAMMVLYHVMEEPEPGTIGGLVFGGSLTADTTYNDLVATHDALSPLEPIAGGIGAKVGYIEYGEDGDYYRGDLYQYLGLDSQKVED